MKNILSHSFIFRIHTTDAVSGQYENILYLNDENNSKHFVQYIQYHENDDDSIDVRHINIKMDRAYFLEIANVCIDDRERRRHFFSTLGKRRFGASNKHLCCYFTHTTYDEKSLHQTYFKHYEYVEFEPCHTIITQNSTNKYRTYIHAQNGLHIVFLDQLNITSRKKIHKVFCIDITDDELDFYNSISIPLQQINYLFNKIGKNHFKSLEITHLKQTTHYKTNEELACSMLITNNQAMERSSRIQDNTTYRSLKERRNEVGAVDETLGEIANKFINNPTIETEAAFTLELKAFIVHIKGISGLKEISAQLSEVHQLTETNTISYLLSKNDHDLKDILIYLLESFGTWNKYLYAQDGNTKSFNASSIDFADALRYFIDICYKFKHEYKCADAEEEIQKEVETALAIEIDLDKEVEPKEIEPNVEIALSSTTSAQSYFSEIQLESEVYDELLELERDIDVLSYASSYTEDITSSLINFFDGYTRVLNPLMEFKDLSYSLMILNQKLSEYTIDDNSEMLLILMRALISDLLEWKRTVLVEQTAEDIHFMDKSFYSNIAQIEMSLEPTVLDDDDGGMEFF
ncbi:hypothetical protein JHD49_04960 [Sulfurimonas sp. SAG-AH-194-C21]|nr:hypothetical protein [Sulfurimonas sp. SAG-AH-194-C21]MDF1883284.1 hypothetical protein [Sulfurimonas sp. SAG-AH-194-C21]